MQEYLKWASHFAFPSLSTLNSTFLRLPNAYVCFQAQSTEACPETRVDLQIFGNIYLHTSCDRKKKDFNSVLPRKIYRGCDGYNFYLYQYN